MRGTYIAVQPPADNDCAIQPNEQVVIPLGILVGALEAEDWAFAPRTAATRTMAATLLNMFYKLLEWAVGRKEPGGNEMWGRGGIYIPRIWGRAIVRGAL